MRRTALILAWVVVACAAWLAASIGGLNALRRFSPDLLNSLVKAIPDIVFLGAILIAGPLLVMGLIAYLGLRGKLPGTRLARLAPPSAFPVVPTPRTGDVG